MNSSKIVLAIYQLKVKTKRGKEGVSFKEKSVHDECRNIKRSVSALFDASQSVEIIVNVNGDEVFVEVKGSPRPDMFSDLDEAKQDLISKAKYLLKKSNELHALYSRADQDAIELLSAKTKNMEFNLIKKLTKSRMEQDSKTYDLKVRGGVLSIDYLEPINTEVNKNREVSAAGKITILNVSSLKFNLDTDNGETYIVTFTPEQKEEVREALWESRVIILFLEQNRKYPKNSSKIMIFGELIALNVEEKLNLDGGYRTI